MFLLFFSSYREVEMTASAVNQEKPILVGVIKELYLQNLT